MALPELDPSEVTDWLARRHGSEISIPEVLQSGFWSAAFGYTADGRELVLSPNEALMERQVCDLERAVLTSGPAQRMERTPSDERASSVRQVGEWPELARNLQLERDHGHELSRL
jgi:hypothetical protein